MPDRVPEGGEGSPKKARDAAELQRLLALFAPPDEWERHPTGTLYSPGIRFLIDEAGATWLVDLIFAVRRRVAAVHPVRLQRWSLEVASHQGTLRCYVGDKFVFLRAIPFTDFPLPDLTLYLSDDMLMLPSEYTED